MRKNLQPLEMCSNLQATITASNGKSKTCTAFAISWSGKLRKRENGTRMSATKPNSFAERSNACQRKNQTGRTNCMTISLPEKCAKLRNRKLRSYLSPSKENSRDWPPMKSRFKINGGFQGGIRRMKGHRWYWVTFLNRVKKGNPFMLLPIAWISWMKPKLKWY